MSNTGRLDHATGALGRNVLALRTDQTDLAQIDHMVSQIGETFGSVDTVFLNTDVTLPAPIKAVTED